MQGTPTWPLSQPFESLKPGGSVKSSILADVAELKSLLLGFLFLFSMYLSVNFFPATLDNVLMTKLKFRNISFVFGKSFVSLVYKH